MTQKANPSNGKSLKIILQALANELPFFNASRVAINQGEEIVIS
jgi:hypothetical protein